MEVPREIFSTFCGLFLLLNDAMQARFWSVVKVGEQVSISVFGSRYFSLIVISNFYHVECGDGRQLRILADTF